MPSALLRQKSTPAYPTGTPTVTMCASSHHAAAYRWLFTTAELHSHADVLRLIAYGEFVFAVATASRIDGLRLG